LLPTGLGKTIEVMLHVEVILGASISTGKAAVFIMTTPPKALLVQHRDLFQWHLRVPAAGLAIVDGETKGL
jgi:ERCC4-related helicase